MRAETFTSQRAGKLVRTLAGYDAFVPEPLPPALQVDWQLGHAIADAERALGNLSGVGGTLPNPHLLINPFMRKEAVLSSRIEGTETSLSELFLFEASGFTQRNSSDAREVSNYVDALGEGIRRLSEIPISLRLFRELHRTLMTGVRGNETTPGEFRTTQNWIGRPGARLDQAIFVPPPVAQMSDCLNAFEAFLHQPQTYPFLVWLALAHYQFEAIHPFRDGNGRIGRLLLVLLMCVHGVLSQPLLYLSAYFEKHRNEYYERLLAVSQRGEWEEWIRFFLAAVESQAKDAIARATTINTLRNAYRQRLQSARSSALLLKAIDQMFLTPAITIPQLADVLHVTYRSAMKIVGKLEAAQILREATGQARNRVYFAPAIFAIVDD